jgi:hypothetical protein
MDSLTIYPASFIASYKGVELSKDAYQLNVTMGTIQFMSNSLDSIDISYRVLPFDLSKTYKNRDTSIIYLERKGALSNFLVSDYDSFDPVFEKSGLQKKGSVSRGISFGNNQNLSVNSTLNLELSGDLSPTLKIMASVTDNNIPLQPEGNSRKLQEFDQVFIQIYNDKFKLIAGDYWLSKPKGYFLNYKKRAQGLFSEYNWIDPNKKEWKVLGGFGFSKGKYARQIISGVEGNQGPYRMRGNDNEPYIIILSGTEKVFIDGRLLVRGQDADYVINYNSGELTFTTKNSITKDIRIVIEFQYSDQNYARALAISSVQLKSKNASFWINSFSEQDLKNQTVQQALTADQKQLLGNVGDSLYLAKSLSIDSIGFVDNQNVYEKKDSSGYSAVLVFSVNPLKALYQAVFSYVGPKKGNYVYSHSTALGKVYVWVKPINNFPQGDFEPIRILFTPKKKQMLSGGMNYSLSKRFSLETEIAVSKEDLNTFSSIDATDDNGVSSKSRLLFNNSFGKDTLKPWVLNASLGIEYLSRNFKPIELFRTVEFDRDWNTRNKGFVGDQTAMFISSSFSKDNYGQFLLEATKYTIGNAYKGDKISFVSKWNRKAFSYDWNSSYLKSNDQLLSNDFIRHKSTFSKSMGKFKIGYTDDQELNTFSLSSDQFSRSSYSFYDYQFFLSNSDSSKWNYRFFFRERYDQRSDSLRLTPVAKAQHVGTQWSFLSTSNQRFNFLLNYRQLSVLNNQLISQTPENTLLGRIDYDLSFWKGVLSWNSFYEIGSGLELKKEFIYIKVNDGQGIYTWIDYNSDGVKDLNEFEIALYSDQASYIRVYTPSNQYVKTYSNEFNQGLFIKPELVWASKSGFKKIASLFSDQFRMRMHRKTNYFDAVESINPFASGVLDDGLISTIYSLRNSLFFNRTGSVLGAEYVFQDNQSKTLLASGFDARLVRYHELNARLTVKRAVILEAMLQQGIRALKADYTTGRDYEISYYTIKPVLSYQPSTSIRFSLESRYVVKKNKTNEQAIVSELTLRTKYNQSEKGSLQANVSYIEIDFKGIANSALGFELLESLQPGKNSTWNFSYQRTVSKKIQLTCQYTGRKSQLGKFIHIGGMEIRAFF